MGTDRDYYSILEVSRNAGQDEIDRSYKRLSALYDPATSKKPRAAQRYAAIQEAYDALSDRRRRGEYDRGRARALAVPGSVQPSEILSNRLVLAGAGALIGAIALTVVLILVLGGNGGEASPPIVADTGSSTPTPVPAPDTPPALAGTEPTVTTDSGLTIITLQEGTEGPSPTDGDTVTVNYTGWIEGGAKFDSSIDRGTPNQFVLGQVIPGWNEGLATMTPGEKVRLIIPPNLGYGDAGEPRAGIEGGDTLIFDVELISFISGTPTPAATPAASDAASTEAPTESAAP